MNYWFLDRILEFEHNRRVLAVRCVTSGEDQFLLHFPVRHIMPGALIIETMSHTGSALLDLSTRLERKSIPLMINRVRFRSPVMPGDRMIILAEAVSIHEDAAEIRFTVKTQEDRVVSDGEITYRIFPLLELPMVDEMIRYTKNYYQRVMIGTRIVEAPPGGMGFIE